ncbi:MAG: polymer-forming cytoskeletal protein [Phycisphaerales bacterium]|nr:polymer-forming cytoskeletal protein [Phycisphaerales bacterium]
MADAKETTVIGPDTHIKGDMSFDSTARIMGNFEGRITAKGDLQITDTATCKASVEATKVQVDGMVDGNVTARDRVELSSKARLKGDVVATRLIVAEGASFVGHCTVGPEAAKAIKSAGGGGSLSTGDNGEAHPEPKVVIPQRAEPAGRR